MAEQNGSDPNILERALAPVIRPAVAREMERRRQGITSELIGRTDLSSGQASLFRSRAAVKTVDETVPDYQFWDRLRRGKAKGFSLGSLFARRIEMIFASWVFGGGVTIQLDESGEPEDENDPRNYTDGLLADFIQSLLEAPESEGDEDEDSALLFQLYEDMLGLGDQYVVVNVDGSLSIPSPDTVEMERDDRDYRTIESVTVQAKLPKSTITDKYTAEAREITVQEGGQIVEEETFPNLIGRIPVVHLAHDRSANETNGRSIHEALRPLYDQYDDLAYKQLDGAKLLGNPLLAFEGMEDINEVINANDPTTQDTYTDKDGATAERTQLNIDQNAVLLIGKGGSAKFVSPPVGFTEDTKQGLKTLFLLLLDHTGIPEFIWGNQLTSSRSTAEVQMTQWTRDVEAKQKRAGGWLLKLCRIWLEVQALTDSRVIVDKLKAEWPPLVKEDEELLLKRIQYAGLRGLTTRRTELEHLHLVPDAKDELEKADAEQEAEREREFPDGDTAAFQAQLFPADEGGE